MTKVAVIGIGQSLRGDDVAGLEAVRQWMEKFPETATRPEVRVEASELPGLALLDVLEGVEAAILVDAVQSTNEPGMIHRLCEEELASFTSNSKSVHGWGVAETLQLRRKLSSTKMNIRIIGIEVEQVETGTQMSKSVEVALPNSCYIIEKEIQHLLS